METQSSTFHLPTTPSAPAPLAYASFWRRLHAYSIDSLLITILCVLITWQFDSPAFAQSPAEAQLDALIAAGVLPEGTTAQNVNHALFDMLLSKLSWADVVLPLIVSSIYNIVFIAGRWQATPGKRLFHAYVVNADGSKLGYQQAALRHVASGASTLLAGLPYLTIFFTREKLAPHDMLCDTRVVIGKIKP